MSSARAGTQVRGCARPPPTGDRGGRPPGLLRPDVDFSSRGSFLMATTTLSVAEICAAAKRASRALATLDVGQGQALEAIAVALESRRRRSSRPTLATSRRRARGTTDPPSSTSSLWTTRGSRQWSPASARSGRCPIPSARSSTAADFRTASICGGQGSARSGRGRLRGSPERHDRRHRAVPEVGQRDRAAWLVGRGAVQRRPRRVASRAAAAGPARRTRSHSSRAATRTSRSSRPRTASSI